MPVDRILQAVRDYLDEEAAVIECAPDKVSRVALTRDLERARKGLRQALADYEAWRIRGRVFHRVMVGIDPSEQSTWALDVAAKLAREEDAAVSLVHVVCEPLALSPDSPYYPSPDIVRDLRSEGEALLRHTRERLSRAIQQNAEEIIRIGDPSREIVKAAEEWHADLIVLGTHGRNALGRLLMGSTAEAVFRHAPCPVLIVRQSPAEVAEAQLVMESLADSVGPN